MSVFREEQIMFCSPCNVSQGKRATSEMSCGAATPSLSSGRPGPRDADTSR